MCACSCSWTVRWCVQTCRWTMAAGSTSVSVGQVLTVNGTFTSTPLSVPLDEVLLPTPTCSPEDFLYSVTYVNAVSQLVRSHPNNAALRVLPVRSCVCFNSKTKRLAKTKIDVNVPRNRSNQRVKFQFKRSEVRVTVAVAQCSGRHCVRTAAYNDATL